ncbi:hypothetical protein R3A25_002355 [Klebsiella oxytoca]|nr:hypothetical protein [Klebsiella oxytoca]
MLCRKSEQAGLSATTSSRLFLCCFPFCCCSLPDGPLASAEEAIIEDRPFTTCLGASPVIIHAVLSPPPCDTLREAFGHQRGYDVMPDKVSWVHAFSPASL